ncbi:MAG: hypothetical protein TU35_009950 [Thermoproteus sp. AZ2]|jgi:hypothetical protein|uniref:Uncharacterized protein n=1 Tax=Thermoproteus sp. AZ2 TaxID=1609232 RepID=A0ACC6V3A1_9CREN
MEAAQMVLIFALAVAIAFALFFIVTRMIAAAPVPNMYVDTYNSTTLPNEALIAVRSEGPVTVVKAWLVAGGGLIPAQACGVSGTELLMKGGWSCNDVSYFFLLFKAGLTPGKYALIVETAKGNYTMNFILG